MPRYAVTSPAGSISSIRLFRIATCETVRTPGSVAIPARVYSRIVSPSTVTSDAAIRMPVSSEPLPSRTAPGSPTSESERSSVTLST